MKKRIGTLKGKPIVEGGGSNIIKENEININDIGSSSDSNDDDISYFGLVGLDPVSTDKVILLFPFNKIVDFRNSPVKVELPAISGYPDYDFFVECGGNINNKSIYTNGNWISIKDYLLETMRLNVEWFKPISKEDFYRTDYTQEEARKIKQDYYDYVGQFAPSETE